mmetsp:Transcript_51717/g.76650  ORF Transcript_51717/g.76650 Transcript_51717/m.76650 type:complete len:265 (+) Transcript_51717:1431-2225(+)
MSISLNTKICQALGVNCDRPCHVFLPAFIPSTALQCVTENESKICLTGTVTNDHGGRHVKVGRRNEGRIGPLHSVDVKNDHCQVAERISEVHEEESLVVNFIWKFEQMAQGKFGFRASASHESNISLVPAVERLHNSNEVAVEEVHSPKHICCVHREIHDMREDKTNRVAQTQLPANRVLDVETCKIGSSQQVELYMFGPLFMLNVMGALEATTRGPETVRTRDVALGVVPDLHRKVTQECVFAGATMNGVKYFVKVQIGQEPA